MTQKIIEDFKADNQFAFGELYRKYFPSVKAYILNNKGQLEDAEDLFQEAMIILYQKLERDDFALTASLKTYIVAICKNLWFKKLRDQHSELSLDQLKDPGFLLSVETAIEEERTYRDHLQNYMSKISEHCNRLINDMFYRGRSIEEVQAAYGYSTKHNAINQKHKCTRQIRQVKAADLTS